MEDFVHIKERYPKEKAYSFNRNDVTNADELDHSIINYPVHLYTNSNEVFDSVGNYIGQGDMLDKTLKIIE
jgi:hypothetical protein